MTKIGKALRGLLAILRQPSLLNVVLEHSDHYKKMASTAGFDRGLPLIPFESLVPSPTTVHPLAGLDGGSLPTDLALLRALAGRFQAKTYFEIGTWRGESVSNVAAIVPECHTLNLPVDALNSLGLPSSYIDQHGFFSRSNPRIRQHWGDSRHFAFNELQATFDLLFVDGDHHFDMVKNDTQQVVQHLYHEKSLIVWHDYAHHPEKIRWEVLAGILAGLPADLHNRLYHVSHTKCAVLLPESGLSDQYLTWPASPSLTFSMDLQHHATSIDI